MPNNKIMQFSYLYRNLNEKKAYEKYLGQYCNIYIFLSFLGTLLKPCIIFEMFLQFSLPPPYKKLRLGKNSGYTRPTFFFGVMGGVGPV